MRGWRSLARLPPALLLATGKDPLCSEYLTAAIVSGAAVVSIDHEQKSFLEFCGYACGGATRSPIENSRLFTAPLRWAFCLNFAFFAYEGPMR
jgi:hypothetical protein